MSGTDDGAVSPGRRRVGPAAVPAVDPVDGNHESGSLVLDFSANGTVVWRGVAQAQIKMDADDKKREAILREGVRDLLKRYPPKS